MSVTVSYKSFATVAEILETGVPAASDAALTHNGYNTTETLGAATTPPSTKCAIFEKALSGGAATIDLENMTGTNGAAVVGTGLQVQVAKFRNPSTNAADMHITFGAANGYDGFGATFDVNLEPGAEMMMFTNDGGAVISATNSDITIAGAGVEVLECLLILG